jgi:hypothetical protein
MLLILDWIAITLLLITKKIIITEKRFEALSLRRGYDTILE